MGGRGSAYEDMDYLEEIVQNQYEDYNTSTKMDIKEFFEDEESEIIDENFKKLKQLNISMRKSTDNLYRISLDEKQKQVMVLCKEYSDYFKETPQDVQFAGKNIRDRGTGGYTGSYYDNGIKIRMVLDSKRVNNPEYERKEIEQG